MSGLSLPCQGACPIQKTSGALLSVLMLTLRLRLRLLAAIDSIPNAGGAQVGGEQATIGGVG